jgi:hypothetical protein
MEIEARRGGAAIRYLVPAWRLISPIAGLISFPIMAIPHPRIIYALPPKRRRVAKARPSRQEVPTIVGPEPQPREPDPDLLARADKADELFRELVRQATGDQHIASVAERSVA